MYKSIPQSFEIMRSCDGPVGRFGKGGLKRDGKLG